MRLKGLCLVIPYGCVVSWIVQHSPWIRPSRAIFSKFLVLLVAFLRLHYLRTAYSISTRVYLLAYCVYYAASVLPSFPGNSSYALVGVIRHQFLFYSLQVSFSLANSHGNFIARMADKAAASVVVSEKREATWIKTEENWFFQNFTQVVSHINIFRKNNFLPLRFF